MERGHATKAESHFPLQKTFGVVQGLLLSSEM